MIIDVFIYIATVLVTLVWSIRTYSLWESRAGLREDAPVRLFLLAVPSVYVFAIAISGWSRGTFLRLDLLGLVVLVALTVLSLLGLVIGLRIGRSPRSGFLAVVSSYHALALMLVGLLYLVRMFPPILIRISSWLVSIERIDPLGLTWSRLTPDRSDGDVETLLGRIIIALFSYLPVSLLRILYAERRSRKLARELDILTKRVHDMEARLDAMTDEHRVRV